MNWTMAAFQIIIMQKDQAMQQGNTVVTKLIITFQVTSHSLRSNQFINQFIPIS